DIITGRWKSGKTGTVRTERPYGDYGAVVFRHASASARNQAVMQSRPKAAAGYRPLLVEIVKFFETKQPPVANDATLEIFAFMDAAQRSKEEGGKPVRLR